MALFGRSRERDTASRHDLRDIPIGSVIELSDETTVEEFGPRAYEVVEYRKYEAAGLLRYMYRMVDEDDEEIVLGVDRVHDTGEFEVARFIIDSEEEMEEPLEDFITLHYDDPEDPDEMISLEFERDEVLSVAMTLVDAGGVETHTVELHEYIADEDVFMSVEVWGNQVTFYVGELIDREDVGVSVAT